MNTAVNVNVVHESEAQRQFARVKLPARIRYIGANREGVDARLLDLSAGGFAFTASGAPIQPGDLYKGKLLFQVDSISFSLEVEFQVRSVDPASRRVGCEFQNLKPREVAALRYLITSYLAGEVIGVATCSIPSSARTSPRPASRAAATAGWASSAGSGR